MLYTCTLTSVLIFSERVTAMTKKFKKLEDFSRDKRFDIAIRYSRGNYTFHDFSEEYGAPRHIFYAILHSAVEESIVSLKIANRIAEVSINSSYQSVLENYGVEDAERTANRVKRSWDKSLKERETFNFSKKAGTGIASHYADSGLARQDFCNKNHISPELLNRTLKNAIVLNWITDDEVEKLYGKSFNSYGMEKAYPFFEKLWVEREKNRCQNQK